MALTLYAHPFSSYCQKVLIALYENDIPFNLRLLSGEDPAAGRELAARWPLERMPLLVDGRRSLPESSVIIEHLMLHHPGPMRAIPADPEAALQVRLLDRIFDNYVMTPMQRIVFDRIRPADAQDPHGVADAQALLDRSYAWLEGHLATRDAARQSWAAGADFGLADCAAAPALFYADWVHPIGEGLPQLRAYRARLLARPSFARAVEEARPYRGFFPGGAPDRD